LIKDIGARSFARRPSEVLVYAKATVTQYFQYTPRSARVNAAFAFALGISKGERIATYLADEVSAHDRAAVITAEDARASLDQAKSCLRADDADRGGGVNLE
jgi:hypothetical protein